MKVLEDLRQPAQQFILPGGKHKLNSTEHEEELVRLKVFIKIVFGCFEEIHLIDNIHKYINISYFLHVSV